MYVFSIEDMLDGLHQIFAGDNGGFYLLLILILILILIFILIEPKSNIIETT